MNFKYDDYVIFPIIDAGDIVGYISRHIWSKQEIDEYNRRAKHNGKFQIMRYKNSTENDFVKLLYNYDMVIEDITDTVIIVEGIFDVIALTRKLNLYHNHLIAVVATFGKKISDVQIYKLQAKEMCIRDRDNDSQGSNGSGKSAMLEAIAIGITGETLRKIKMEEIINDAADTACIKLTMSNDSSNECMEITRELSRCV